MVCKIHYLALETRIILVIPNIELLLAVLFHHFNRRKKDFPACVAFLECSSTTKPIRVLKDACIERKVSFWNFFQVGNLLSLRYTNEFVKNNSLTKFPAGLVCNHQKEMIEEQA